MTTPPPPEQPAYGPPPGYAPPPPGYAPYPPYFAPPPPSTPNRWGPTSLGMEPNIAAGLSYLIGILGIIFYFIEKQNRFVKFHAAQATLIAVGYLVLVMLWVVVLVAGIIGAAGTNASDSAVGLLIGLLYLALFAVMIAYLALHIWGIVAGFTGKMVKFPIVGAIAERMVGGPVVPLW